MSCVVVLVALLGCPVLPAARAAAPGSSGSARITWYFGLTRPEAAARAAFFAVQRPGSSTYRRFISPRRVAAVYGASPSVRRRFVRLIDGYGFRARVDRSNLFARVQGPVSLFERVFHIEVTVQQSDEPPTLAYAVKPAPHLAPALRPLVDGVVTSYERELPHPGEGAGVNRRARNSPSRTGTWTQGCRQAKQTGAFSYAQVRHAYGIDRLGSGIGASVALLGLDEAPSRVDISDLARCFGYRQLRSHTFVFDGQRRPILPGNSFEPQLDMAMVRGMAPRASITFAQSPDGADGWFFAAAGVLDGRHLPDSFSISYGICERDPLNGPHALASKRAGAALLDSLLVRLGLTGVGSYASAGDSGASCNGARNPHGKPYIRGVTWPASSPYLTAVGGTRLSLTRANRRRNEVVWNDRRWSQNGGSGGGGTSVFEPRPPYQRGLGLPGHGRAIPDVSANASIFPGYPIVDGGSWIVNNGTSASAPLVATAIAVISADLKRRHRPPVGPANGLLYYLSRQRPSALWDVIHGNNRYYPTIPGFYAKPGYDLASGVGVPKFASVLRDLPPPAPTRRSGRG